MIKGRKHRPVDLLPFEIKSLKDFIIDKHEVIDPYLEEVRYREHWTDHINKCLRGVWGHDYDEETKEGGYRWMPGNLFFYVNDTVIKMEEEESGEITKRPLCRDVEWYIFYALTVCDGFSGYHGDEKYTSYRPLGKIQGKVKMDNKEGTLSPAEAKELKQIDHLLRTPEGEYKEYVDPTEYLYRTHEKPLGAPHFHNELRNLILLSTRGVGKSYSIAGGVITYDFVFGSARNAEQFFERKHSSTIVVGSSISKKSDELLSKVIPMYEYMRENVGGFDVAKATELMMYDASEEDNVNSPMYQPFSGSLKVGKVLTNLTPDEGGKSWSGTDNKIVHVSYKDNASAGVGYRARRMVVEEAGLLENFTDVHNENEGSQKRGKKSGYTVYIGTGGDVKKILGIREAFYKPKGFKCFSMPDIFTNKPGKIGLFVPSYYADNRFKDELGNTDKKSAFEQQMFEREEAYQGGSKRGTGQVLSYPIVPHEMFLQSDTNPFPTELIEERLTELETGEWERIAKPGRLTYTNRENTTVRWEGLPLSKCSIIRRFNEEKDMTDEQVKGTIVVYEHPIPGRPELSHYDYIYVVTYDSIRDEDGGTSLACVQVWKFWDFEDRDRVQHNLVAEWMGRHIGDMEKDHEIAFKLASYYNAPLHPEINIKDVLRYGRATGRFYYFLPKPELALEGMAIKQKKEYPVGQYISPGMIPDLEKYLNEALHVVVDRDHRIIGDKEEYAEIKTASQINSMRLCEELLYYSRGNGNFDGVSSAMLFGTVRRQREKQPTQQAEQMEQRRRAEELSNFYESKVFNTNRGSHPAYNY